jgi:hypothetical protein
MSLSKFLIKTMSPLNLQKVSLFPNEENTIHKIEIKKIIIKRIFFFFYPKKKKKKREA